jgi:hypothetical protein
VTPLPITGRKYSGNFTQTRYMTWSTTFDVDGGISCAFTLQGDVHITKLDKPFQLCYNAEVIFVTNL